MFCGRTANNKINRLHERALRIAYEDFESTFEELLTKDGSVTIHQRNLRALAIEMYKVSNKLSPSFMSDLFIEKNVLYICLLKFALSHQYAFSYSSLLKPLKLILGALKK